jgi:hypothetical protein
MEKWLVGMVDSHTPYCRAYSLSDFQLADPISVVVNADSFASRESVART